MGRALQRDPLSLQVIMTWRFPLAHFHGLIPEAPHVGAFGVRRKFDVHTGVDLYCAHGNEVFAVEDGVVVAREIYTGPRADSPWWNETYAVLVEGVSGVVCYGEIAFDRALPPAGQKIYRGQRLGTALTVLKRYKGRPTTMLHFELYEHGVRESTWWRLDEDKPAKLLDPTEKLKEALER